MQTGNGRAATAEEVAAVRAAVRVARHLERAACGLSPAHYRVLAAIEDGSGRASRVATSLALGKPTVSAAVEALCQRGLLERQPDATDQRVASLALTEAGHRSLAAADSAMAESLAELCRRAGDAGLRLHACLRALGAALDDLAAESGARRR